MRTTSPARTTRQTTAMQAIRWILLAVLVFVAQAFAFVPQAFAEDLEPEGLEVLRRADAAVRAASAVRYDFEYLGTGVNRSRVAGMATLMRLESGRLAYRAEIGFALPPPGFEAHPRHFALASDGDLVWRRDDSARQLERASLSAKGGYLTRAFGFALLPQWQREEPFGVEMNDSEVVRHAGRTTLDGMECDVVFVGFSSDSGLGDQYFFIGREDGLPRRVMVVAPANSPGQPTWHFELRMSNLQRVDAAPRSVSLAAPDGYREIDVDRRAVEPGATAPSWRLAAADGATVDVEELRGMVVVLDFWASWCPFCIALLPATEELRADYAAADVAVYTVHIWDVAEPEPVLRARGIDLPILVNGDSVADLYKVGSTPTALVIGRDGRIVHRETGNTEDRDARLRAAIERALAGG